MKGLVVYRKGPHLGVEIDGEVYISIPRKKLKGEVFVGDSVEGEIVDARHFRIDKVADRRNLLPKPRVANVDIVLTVFSFKNPDMDPLHLDGILAVLEKEGIDGVVVFNKKDLATEEEIQKWYNVYFRAGYKVVITSVVNKEGADEIRKIIRNKTTVLAGPSGAGKTSIINAFLPDVKLKVGEIGKYGKGKHTTTDIRLIKNPDGGYICDTPGFARFDISEFVSKDEFPYLYREFKRFKCKFSNCTHTVEPGCGVIGNIEPERYRTYVILLNKLKQNVYGKG